MRRQLSNWRGKSRLGEVERGGGRELKGEGLKRVLTQEKSGRGKQERYGEEEG